MDCDTFLTYTYFNKTFKIHTDARNFQLGAFIIKKVKPIDLYGIHITDVHKRYRVTEKELLRIVETLNNLELY